MEVEEKLIGFEKVPSPAWYQTFRNKNNKLKWPWHFCYSWKKIKVRGTLQQNSKRKIENVRGVYGRSKIVVETEIIARELNYKFIKQKKLVKEQDRINRIWDKLEFFHWLNLSMPFQQLPSPFTWEQRTSIQQGRYIEITNCSPYSYRYPHRHS